MSKAKKHKETGGLKPAMKIGLDTLAAFQPRAAYPAAPLGMADPLPGVLPKGVVAADTAMAKDYDMTAAFSAASGGLVGGQAFPGFPFLAELAQRPEYRRISETIAKEMTREWIKIQAASKDDKSDRVAEIEKCLEEFNVQDSFRRIAEYDGFYGRGQIYIDLGNDDPAELETPLIIDPRKIKKGALKGLRAVEPIWTYPNAYNAYNPLAADFFRPQSWFVMGKKIHHTRLLTFISREPPDILKPGYAFSGLSMSQMAMPYVENWLRTRQSISDLIHSFSVTGVKTNMAASLDMHGPEIMERRAHLFNLARDNRGLMMIDKDTEDFFNVSTPLSTLDHLQAQAQEHMASVSGIPLVKLLGITPSGLNASSDGEVRVFYDWIHAQQEHLFAKHLRVILNIIQCHLFGDIDPDITFDFEPLWQLDEAGEAVVRKTDMDTDVEGINAGILHPAEARARLARDPGSPYAGLDVDDVPEPPDEEAPIPPDPARGAISKRDEFSGDSLHD